MGKMHFYLHELVRVLCLFAAICVLILSPIDGIAKSETDTDTIINLESPQEDEEVVAKKPLIKCSFTLPVSTENLLVILDGVDITGVLRITDKGFEYRPVQVLSPGPHTISITGQDRDGMEFEKQFSFSTRHTHSFEEAYSSNEVTANYEAVLKKPDDVDMPYSKLEANMGSSSRAKSEKWDFTFNTNLRYFDQSDPLTSPLEKGLDVVNYLFTGTYQGDQSRLVSEIGDVQINETSSTVFGLARRGGAVSMDYKDVNLKGFMVMSDQVFGLKNGLGIEGSSHDHIMGISSGVNLFSNKANLKTIYVQGGEPSSSFGLWTTDGGTKGEVLGLALTSELIEQKLGLETELDFSEYDPDTSDEFAAENDKNYRLRSTTNYDRYSLDALYEYVGAQYAVVGNQGFQKDREGIALSGTAYFDIHTFLLAISRYNDNVEDDSLYPRIYSYQGTLDYNFTKFPSLPMGLTWEKSIQDSKNEPEYTPSLRLDTDTLMGRINYFKGAWNYGFQAAYSFMNDKTLEGNDNTNWTLSFIPTYFSERFSLSPSFSYNRSKLHLIDVNTDTYTIGLDMRGDFIPNKLTYEVAGTFNLIKADDDSSDQDTYSANLRLAYQLGEKYGGLINPTLALRGIYNSSKDRIYHQENEELVFIFVFSNSLKFSF